MGKYKLSDEALDDLERIYLRGYVDFGQAQADRYFAELYEKFQEIADNPLIYQSVDEMRPGYRRSVCKSNSIYYRLIHDGVEIMGIVGRQDANTWL